MIELTSTDARYPARLRDLRPLPDPIWADGDLDAFAGPAVAIVGTRRMTGYGERVAREVAIACAAAGVVVVSGFAQGIDTAAHRGALDGRGRTIAVLGESIPVLLATVRTRRRALVPRIRATGLLVSQFRAPLAARGWMFAERNATIAALAEAVVIVEAPTGSGALITAQAARRLGRALFAVPGPLGSSASVGTNRLIGAAVARTLISPDDVLDAIGARAGPAVAAPFDPLLVVLGDGPLGLDEIALRLRLSPAAVSARIAPLLVRGMLRALPDGRIGLML